MTQNIIESMDKAWAALRTESPPQLVSCSWHFYRAYQRELRQAQQIIRLKRELRLLRKRQ